VDTSVAFTHGVTCGCCLVSRLPASKQTAEGDLTAAQYDSRACCRSPYQAVGPVHAAAVSELGF
ncbi:hypothetical protein MAQ58_25250, partial [Enterobacter sp. DRP3]|nr:hypothetical protein [Enterobacter sp. DRP3]